MKHSIIIKKIHTLFLNDFKDYLADNNWTHEIRLDSTQEITNDNPFITLTYIPFATTQKYLSKGSYNYTGYLRVGIYEKNPTKNMILTDLIVEYLKDNDIDGLRYSEKMLSGADRSNPGDLFFNFIDFKVCVI